MIMYVPVTTRANTVTVRPVELVCFSLLSYTLNDNVCTSDIKGKYCYCEPVKLVCFSLLSYTLNDNVCTSDIKGKYCYCQASRVGLFLLTLLLSE